MKVKTKYGDRHINPELTWALWRKHNKSRKYKEAYHDALALCQTLEAKIIVKEYEEKRAK